MAQHQLITLVERLGRYLSNSGHSHNLKPVQWEILRYLAKANRFSRSPSAVTQYLGITKGTVSQSITTLQSKGLLDKVLSATDKRSVSLALTNQGQALVAQDPSEYFDQALASMPPQDLAQATQTLQTLLTESLKKAGNQPFGQCQTCTHFRSQVSNGQPHFCALLNVPLNEQDAELICVEQQP